MDKINDFLDRYILPWPVRFLTFRFVILLTIALLIPLIVFASNTVMVLLLNSYLNTMSVAVSSIVLLYATISEVRQKQIADLQEKRAQEDHTHVCDMHDLVLKSLQNQQQEIHELRELLALMNGQKYERPEQPELPDLYASHPRGKERFENNDHVKRYQKSVHHNQLTSTVRESILSSQSNEPNY
jgi:hypothetical protein